MKRFIAVGALSLAASAATAGGPTAPVPEPGVAAPVAAAPAAFDWSGAYAGLSLGYSSGDGSTSGTNPVVSRSEYGVDGSLLGGYLGYLWQRQALVYSVEADLQIWSLSGDDGGAFGVTDGVDGDFLGSLRGRVGYAAGRTLVYGSVGLEIAKLDVIQSSTAPTASTSTSFTETGWSAGLGVEQAISDRATLGIEYRYFDFSEALDTPENSVSFDRSHALDGLQSPGLRLSYRF